MIVPVSPNGGIQHYPQREWFTGDDGKSERGEIEWKDIEEFFLVLKLQGLHRGRSAAFFWWKDESTGATYPMFMVDLTDLIQRRSVYLGVAAEHWRPAKRGENYGIRLRD